MILSDLVGEFLLGIATPLTAACAIPLYPAFISYLASTGEEQRHSPLVLGLVVVAGVLTFMASVGILYSYILQISVGVVVSNISPVAFVTLAVVGAVLLIDPKVFSRIPSAEPPQSRYPVVSAFSYGFFFGPIILPCNPGTIFLFFARTPVLYDSHAESMLAFLSFGLGIGAPLLAFAVLSEVAGQRVTRTLARYSSPINRAVGGIMLVVALYYLISVFEVVPIELSL